MDVTTTTWDTLPAPLQAGSLPPDMFQRVGTLARQLHDALTGLGYADSLQRTVDRLPDAQNRLAYVARLTGEAAEKVLERVDQAKAEQDRILQVARMLASSGGTAGTLAAEVAAGAARTDAHLTEIMLAQDFHDLTNQVIRRLTDLATQIERQLVEMLVLSTPGGATAQVDLNPALAGPVVAAAADVVTSQSQVDELLASLGF